MKIAILGFGREGKSVLKFLKKNNPRANITILDKKLNKNYLKNLSRFDLIFRSPGVPYNLPKIQKAVKAGVKFSSSTHLFFENYKGLIIGIAGTKGKGTTSTLIYRILKAASKSKTKNPLQNRKVFLAGNIGTPMLGILPKLNKKSISILELSSFQIQDLKKSPNIAVVLGFFPDHLDVHKDFKEYIEAEGVIAKYQTPKDVIFYFSENRYSKKIAGKSRAKKINVSHQKPENSFLSEKDFEKIKKIIKIPGEHNFKNAIMAATVAGFLKTPKEIIFKTISDFKGNEHRLELVRTLSASIKIYNDSASTTPETAAAAVQSFKEPKILIAGGKDKGLNYSPLVKALKNSNTQLVILFGQNKNKIKKAIRNSGVPVKIVENLKKAIDLSYKSAKFLILNSVFASSKSPEGLFLIILFSPASASFDMFKDYADRGKIFKKLVKRLK